MVNVPAARDTTWPSGQALMALLILAVSSWPPPRGLTVAQTAVRLGIPWTESMPAMCQFALAFRSAGSKLLPFVAVIASLCVAGELKTPISEATMLILYEPAGTTPLVSSVLPAIWNLAASGPLSDRPPEKAGAVGDIATLTVPITVPEAEPATTLLPDRLTLAMVWGAAVTETVLAWLSGESLIPLCVAVTIVL